MKPFICGCGGVAGSGKNLFVDLSKQHLAARGYRVASLAFATELRFEVYETLMQKHGISSFTQDPKQKAIIRPELIAHGKKRRAEQTDYWASKVMEKIDRLTGQYDIVLIEDVRFASSEIDEVATIHKRGGLVVYVERVMPDGSILPPNNPEEEKHDPALRMASDYMVSWPTLDKEVKENLDILNQFVDDVWSKVITLNQL